MVKVPGRKVGAAKNMPADPRSSRPVARPAPAPSRRSAARQSHSSLAAEASASAAFTSRKAAGFGSTRAAGAATAACSSTYSHDRSANFRNGGMGRCVRPGGAAEGGGGEGKHAGANAARPRTSLLYSHVRRPPP